MARAVAVAAGGCAVASGLAYLLYFASSGRSDWAITGWNLLIIPTAVVLGLRLASRGSLIAAGATAAGIASSVLWAFDFRRPAVEPWWIALAAVWWLGLGWALRQHDRRTASFTLVLGMAAAIDLVVSLGDAPLPWLAIGALKLPLTTVWSIWVGVLLISDGAVRGGRSTPSAAGAVAFAGGAVWVIGAVGWLLTHGTQPDPNAAELFALRGTEFTQLLAVASLLWAVAALAWALSAEVSRLHRNAAVVALLGAVMVSLGAFLETSVVDPVRDFRHPAVQGGWLLFIGGLLPMMSLGMLGLAAGARESRVLRSAFALAGVLAPLPVLAFSIGGWAAGGTGWVVVLAGLHAAPGLGWMAVGRARMSDKSLVDGGTTTDEQVRALISDGGPSRRAVEDSGQHDGGHRRRVADHGGWRAMTRLAGAVAAIAGAAWAALFGANAFNLRMPDVDGVLWAFPLAFGAGTVALFRSDADAGPVHQVGGALAGVVAVASSLAYAGSLLSADEALAYHGWLGFVLGIVLLFGLVLLYGVVHLRRGEDRDPAAITALAASGPPFGLLVMILAYKLATGWWVTDPGLIAIGEVGSAILIGGGWLALGTAVVLRKVRPSCLRTNEAVLGGVARDR